jgi:hypothetical protein
MTNQQYCRLFFFLAMAWLSTALAVASVPHL